MKKWRVDVNGRQDAILMLSAVNLPGGVQRRKTEEDELKMRSFFQENDWISAEVQQQHSDGSLALHTRSLRYGRLEGGVHISIPSGLVQRARTSFVQFADEGVEVVLGCNGYVWIGGLPDAKATMSMLHEQITRVRNCILSLVRRGDFVSDASLSAEIARTRMMAPVEIAYLRPILAVVD